MVWLIWLFWQQRCWLPFSKSIGYHVNFFDFNGSWFTFYKIFKRIQKGLKIFEWHCLHNFALNWFRECIKGQIWKTIVNDFFQNILDGVKSSGTVLEETSCTILSPNILDMVKSSGTDLKKSHHKQFCSDCTRWCQM